MIIEPTRYRQRPPEVDALLIAPDTVDAAVEWLRTWNRDGYAMGTSVEGGLAVMAGRDGAPRFDVPWGRYLVRDVHTGGWAPVPADQLEREFVSAREDDRRRRGYI